MSKLFFLFLFSILLISADAQQKHTINGNVKDSKTGEVLIGASIVLPELKGYGVITNSYGFYSLSAPDGNYTLIASFSGYADDTIKISLTKNITENIALSRGLSELKDVVVTSERSDITQTMPGVQKLSMKEIQDLPVLFGERDILKNYPNYYRV